MPGAIAEDARSRPSKTGCFVRPVPLRSDRLRGKLWTQSATAEPGSPASNHPPGPLAVKEPPSFNETYFNDTYIHDVNNVAGIHR